MNEKRVRYCAGSLVLRSTEGGQDSNGRTVFGYAIRFNEESLVLRDWGKRFVEEISPSCVTKDFLKECDIKMTLFHNREKLLARSNKGEGSMRLGVDSKGVWFEFEAPDTELGNMCLEGVKRGDLSGCSFTFAPKEWVTEERGDNEIKITHTEFDWLGEMTIESDPAYPSTEVGTRSLCEGAKHSQEQKHTLEKDARLKLARNKAARSLRETDDVFVD